MIEIDWLTTSCRMNRLIFIFSQNWNINLNCELNNAVKRRESKWLYKFAATKNVDVKKYVNDSLSLDVQVPYLFY